jgi:hypothetical protein
MPEIVALSYYKYSHFTVAFASEVLGVSESTAHIDKHVAIENKLVRRFKIANPEFDFIELCHVQRFREAFPELNLYVDTKHKYAFVRLPDLIVPAINIRRRRYQNWKYSELINNRNLLSLKDYLNNEMEKIKEKEIEEKE